MIDLTPELLNQRSGQSVNGNVASVAYQQDTLGRLTDLVYGIDPANSTLDIGYGYDAASQLNFRFYTDGNYAWQNTTAVITQYGSVNNLNQYSSATVTGGTAQTISYDTNGNLTSFNGQSYIYNSINQLTEVVTPSDTIGYFYNPMGQRVQKVSLATGIATDYVHNGTNEIAEYADGSLTTRYVYGPGTDETLAQIRYTGTPNNEAETDRRFYYTDGLGSVIATLDSLGNVTKKYSYSPFGINGPGNDHTDQPFGYTGQRYDNDTGLYYYKARYYHAALGRFLSVDPVGYDDQMNLYAYVANRPMGFRDPSGRFQESALNLSTGDFDLWEGDYQDLGDSFLSSVGQQTLNPNPIGRAAAAAQANRDPYAVGLGDFFELLGESAKENLKFGTTLKAAAGPGAGISSLFNANGDTTLNVDYTKGLIFEGGVQFRGDVFSSGTIDGLFQSAEICIAGCIRGAWDYQGNFNIGTRIVIPIAIGGGVSGGYTTSGRSIVDSLSGQ